MAHSEPWFIATEPFTPENGTKWRDYIDSSGLEQLVELVSLDSMLCPTLLPEIKDEYWPHIINEDFMLHFFVDFDFLVKEVASIPRKNVLSVLRNPSRHPEPPSIAPFEFLGCDLVDVQCSASALTNCGGFPDVFANAELSSTGLIPSRERAIDIQQRLRSAYPSEPHADCNVWAIFRLSQGPAAGAR